MREGESPSGVPAPEAPAQLKGVADLLLLQRRLRSAAGLSELGMLLVNDTRLLIPYRTAVLWLDGRLSAVSGVPEPVRDAPFTRWTESLCRYVDGLTPVEPRAVDASMLPVGLGGQWGEYLPTHLLWLPLATPEGEPLGALALARETPWREEERRLLSHWSEAAGHALEAQRLKARRWWRGVGKRSRRRLAAAALLVVLAALWIPVRLSVLAPAEVVARVPSVVRAPLDGVVGEVIVEPNQPVAIGDLLLRLDDRDLKSRLDVAEQELEIARAEHLRAEQAAVADRDASSQIPMLNARIQQRGAEVEYVRSLLERIEVRAEQAGIAVIPDATELEGRPVKIGQRLMILADPAEAEVEAWLPVGDSLRLQLGTPVELYLNVAPERPLDASLRRMDYQAQISPEGILAFRLRAAFADAGEPPRIGWRGTAKVYGEPAPLYYYLFRRPFAALRQMLGL